MLQRKTAEATTMRTCTIQMSHFFLFFCMANERFFRIGNINQLPQLSFYFGGKFIAFGEQDKKYKTNRNALCFCSSFNGFVFTNTNTRAHIVHTIKCYLSVAILLQLCSPFCRKCTSALFRSAVG